MSARIKPELYISWIPTGKIGVTPLLFASFIPEPSRADLFRKVTKSEKTPADSVRIVASGEKISADLLRNLVDTENFSADTLRKLFSEETISADTFRRIVQAGGVPADTFRLVKSSEKTVADTSRKIAITSARADLQRIVHVSEKSNVDTFRHVTYSEKFSADLYLRIVDSQHVTADTCRVLKNFSTARADTLIKIGSGEKFFADTHRVVVNTEKTVADTSRLIKITEKVIADLLRGLRDFVRADTSRLVKRTEKTIADTVIRVPHILKYIVQTPAKTLNKTKAPLLRDNPTSLVSTFEAYGVTAINITLNERTLSDNFTFEITCPMTINEAVEGWLLDYEFRFLVEEITQHGIVRSVKGMYNQDELLYTWFQMPYGNDGNDSTKDKYPTATAAISEIAADLGLTPVISIDEFTPSNLSRGAFVTYADVLNSLFSWTSRLPQRQINVFIRGDKLFVIQRGKETNTFDITNLLHSIPTINQKLNRVLCHNPAAKNNSNDDDDDDKAYPFSGPVHYSATGVAPFNASVNVSLTYQNGLLIREYMSMQTAMFESDGENLMRSQTSETTYSYEQKFVATGNLNSDGSQEYKPEWYVSDKETRTSTTEQNFTQGEIEHNDTTERTTYFYETTSKDTIYLFHEQTSTETQSYTESQSTMPSESWQSDKDMTRQTGDVYHFPLGNGFYSQVSYINGIVQGASISQGAPSNRVSQYTIDKTQASFAHTKIIVSEESDFNDQLQAIVDDSFPVREDAFKQQLNEDLRSLHRAIVETVSVDLISKVVAGIPEIYHIVDFNDKIVLDGNSYHLLSNNITFTPRKLIQKLQLIRWF